MPLEAVIEGDEDGGKMFGRAKIMPIESKMPINEIADNLGYSNATHFIRQFTGKVGISPLKYRSKYLTDKK